MNKGFSLITTVIATFIFTAVGFAVLILSDEGFKLTSVTLNHNVAEVNSSYALGTALEHLASGGDCGESRSGSINGGSWEYRTLSVGDYCFVLARGERGTGQRYKIAYVKVSGGGILGALTVNYFNNNYFRLINRSRIEGNGECPAVTYYDCGNVCDEIERYVRDAEQLGEPLNIAEVVLRNGRATLDELRQYFVEEFNDIFENYTIPQPPPINAEQCVVDNVRSCRGTRDRITCYTPAGSVDIRSGDCTYIEIGGSYIEEINLWNAELSSSLIIRADRVEEVRIGNSSIGAVVSVPESELPQGLFITADRVDSIEMNNDSVIYGNLVVRANTVERVSLVNDSQIKGSLILSLGNSARTGIRLTNSSAIQGDVYFSGESLTLDPSNEGRIGGDVIARAEELIRIDLVNRTAINGQLFLYGEEIYIRGVNRSRVEDIEGERRNIIIGEEEVRIELTNNARQGNIGYVVTLGSDSEIYIRLTNEGSLEGMFLTAEFDADLVNHSSITGIILTERIEREIRMPNHAEINGLIAAFDSIREIELVNHAQIEGIVLADSLDRRLRLTNRARISLNLELVNQLINRFGLEGFLNLLVCDSGGASGNAPSIPQGLVGSVF